MKAIIMVVLFAAVAFAQDDSNAPKSWASEPKDFRGALFGAPDLDVIKLLKLDRDTCRNIYWQPGYRCVTQVRLGDDNYRAELYFDKGKFVGLVILFDSA